LKGSLARSRDNVDRSRTHSVGVVKTVRTQRKHRIRICRDDAGRKQAQKETVVEQGIHFYASNLELGARPVVFVHQLGRSRWVIDTEVFQTITTDGHLKKPSAHQRRSQAFIVLTMLRVLAFTLTPVFFHRQVRSPLPKVFARVLRSSPETGRSVSRYSAVGFHLTPTPIGTLRARVLRVLRLLFSLALPRARPQRLAPRQLLQKPSGSAKQGNAC
jgi:hypothetical protein